MRYRLDLGSKYDLADLARKRSEHATVTLANQGNYEPGYVRVMVKLRSFIVNITNFSQNHRDYKTAARYQISIFRTIFVLDPVGIIVFKVAIGV